MLHEARADLGDRRFASESVDDISSETRRLLDQLAYRFGKLQRSERLGVIPSVNQWWILRELRNQLAHEYLDAPALKAAALNRFIDGVDSLLALWQKVSGYAQQKRWSEAKRT